MIEDVGPFFSSGELAELCERWKVRELALFGSALRDEYGPRSDLDFLVTFADDAEWGLLDHVQMQFDLERLLGRKVDLLSRRGLEQSHNWLLREEILNSARVVFKAGEASHGPR